MIIKHYIVPKNKLVRLIYRIFCKHDYIVVEEKQKCKYCAKRKLL